MKKTPIITSLTTALLLACAGLSSAQTEEYLWQQDFAKINPQGTLEWAPKPFEFQAGSAVRYIDFENGDDANAGTSKEQAWKHHPWDANAGGQAAQAPEGPVTYVFKGGVIYRGTLSGTPKGTADEPVRFTTDPSWGNGQGLLYGSHQITGGWAKGGEGLPDKLAVKDKVWFIDLPQGVEPRNIWMVKGEDVSPLPVARIPNWHIEGDDDDDPKEDWFIARKTAPHVIHEGEYRYEVELTDELPRDPEFYNNGAYMRYEWGPVMGTPAPATIYHYDPEKHAVRVQAFFPKLLKQGEGYLGKRQIFGGSAYSFENNPLYIDEPGEWWFAESGPNKGRLYLLPPEGIDPNSATFEAAQHQNLIAMTDSENVEISGLTFRFTNMPPRLYSAWQADPAAILHTGPGKNILIHHNTLEYNGGGVDINPGGDGIDLVEIADNSIHHADHMAIDAGGPMRMPGAAGDLMGTNRIHEIRVLRNKMSYIGFHPMRVTNGHAVTTHFPYVLAMAGNILHRTGGWGLAAFGGKPSGHQGDAPFTRQLIFQNSVTDPMLFSNDWGGIETWQGGPFYVFNNHVHNPIGIMGFGSRRFGHAYYMDGAFKNYFFNNVASGESSKPDDIESNIAAFQEIHSYANTIFHNTVFRFLNGSRRQAAEPGRNKYIGNVFQDIGERVFRHSDSKNTDPNAFDAGDQSDHFAYETNAYSHNVFFNVEKIGNFHATGGDFATPEAFGDALKQVNTMASDVGVMAESPILRAPENSDFRLTPGSPARKKGSKVFVPWSLYATVGEWHFTRNNADPTEVIDEAWYLTDYHIDRETYETRPTYPLSAQNIAAENYVEGHLEDWTVGALKLDGQSQFLTLSQETLTKPFEYKGKVKTTSGAWAEITLPKALKVGEKSQMTVTLLDPPQGQKLSADLNWMDGTRFRGFNAWGGKPKDVTGAGPYTFEFTPEDKPGLAAFQLNLYLSPDGQFKNATQKAQQEIPAGESTDTQTLKLGGSSQGATQNIAVTGKDLKNPQVHDSSFLIEAFLKVESGAGEGIIARKMSGQTGYSLTLNAQGQPVFALADGSGTPVEVTAQTAIANGQWHHLLAEADREAGKVTIFIDGKAAGTAEGLSQQLGTLANDADLFVGGSPDGGHLPVTLDFLRISLGSLADARTTIEELFAWQFDGPFLRDFVGQAPAQGQSRDAGALQAD